MLKTSDTGTHVPVQGKSLHLMRGVWGLLLLLTLLYTGLVFSELLQSGSSIIDYFGSDLTPAGTAALTSLGIPLNTLIIIQLVIVAAASVINLIVAALIVAKRSDSWIALVAALLIAQIGLTIFIPTHTE